MSLWGRLRARLTGKKSEPGRSAAAEAEPRGARARSRAESPPRPKTDVASADGVGDERADEPAESELSALGRAGQAGGPRTAEVMALLRRYRGTTREVEALERALSAGAKLPEPARIACAEMLAARGDESGARRLLERVTSTAGLVLAADLHAQAGDLARAAGTVERVLARDIDAPGARERHERWRRALGWESRRDDRLDEETVLAARPRDVAYRLVREVARGGSGTVYEAEEPLLGRRVAFKVYHRRGRDRSTALREVRGAIQVAGPGVIRLYDASPDEGWIALEWIRRGSVRDLLRGGEVAALLPMGPWAVALARTLSRVHQCGWVHGDVKPANVLLRSKDDPVLGDFGIARPVGESVRGGSPGYISPERLAGAAAAPRDDVYGFGRIVEDVLFHASDRVDEAPEAADSQASRAPDWEAWRTLSLLCLAPVDERPADGSALLREVRCTIEQIAIDSG